MIKCQSTQITIDEFAAISLAKDVDIQTEKIDNHHIAIQVELPDIIMKNKETNHSPHVYNELEMKLNTVGESDNTSNSSMTKNCRVVEPINDEPTITNTKNVKDKKADLGPIVGYADEPLLLLSKACSPLMNVIDNLSYYVQMAIDETPEEPSDELTIDESASIRLYTIEWNGPHRSLYSMLNRTLKYERRFSREYFSHLVGIFILYHRITRT